MHDRSCLCRRNEMSRNSMARSVPWFLTRIGGGFTGCSRSGVSSSVNAIESVLLEMSGARAMQVLPFGARSHAGPHGPPCQQSSQSAIRIRLRKRRTFAFRLS